MFESLLQAVAFSILGESGELWNCRNDVAWLQTLQSLSQEKRIILDIEDIKNFTRDQMNFRRLKPLEHPYSSYDVDLKALHAFSLHPEHPVVAPPLSKACADIRSFSTWGLQGLGAGAVWPSGIMTLPVRWSAKFFQGLKSPSAPLQRGPSYTQTLDAAPTAVLQNAGAAAIFQAPLWMTGAWVTFGVDQFWSAWCERHPKMSENLSIFCRFLKRQRDTHYQWAESGRKLGSRLRYLFEKRQTGAVQSRDCHQDASLLASDSDQVERVLKKQFPHVNFDLVAPHAYGVCPLFRIRSNPSVQEFDQIQLLSRGFPITTEPPTQEAPQNSVCDTLFQEQFRQHFSRLRDTSVSDEILMSLNPSRSITIHTHSLATSKEKFSRSSAFPEAGELWVLIPQLPRERDDQQLRQGVTDWSQVHQQMQKMIKSFSYRHCKTNEANWSLRFEKIRSEMAHGARIVPSLQHDIEAQAYDHVADKIQRDFRHWKIHRYQNLNAIVDALRSSRVRQLVLLVHGDEQRKRWVDPTYNEIPSTVFNDVSSALQGVHVYSCFGSSILNRVPYREYFAASPSEHAFRRFTVIDQSDVFPISGTPLLAFGAFLKTIDEWAKKDAHVSARIQALRLADNIFQEPCRIRVKGLRVTQGVGLVKLGTLVLGVMTAGQNQLESPLVDCSTVQFDASPKTPLDSGIAIYGVNQKIPLRYQRDSTIKVEVIEKRDWGSPQ